MKKFFGTLFGSLLFVAPLVAQNHPVYFCGQVAAQKKLFGHHPGAEQEIRTATDQLEAETRDYVENRGGDDQVYIIPVVFHIIHSNGNENISDEQVQDAVNILTRDFRKLNADTSIIVDEFVDIASDTRIEFRLAAKDPNGNCHTGINRIVSDLTTDGGNPDMKALSYWPRNKYMNIWVCQTIGDNVAGFTQLPGDVNSPWAADIDGIVIQHNYCGSIGTASPFTSRTLTHEVGHWLNLYHTWGPGNSPGDPNNCDIDDLVSDTPNTIGWTGCTLNGSSCSSTIDNVQNYMEYSYCSRMFTWGQRQRMRAALTSNTAQRNQLWTTSNLEATGVVDPPLCIAKFSSPMTSVCVGDTVSFFDDSYHGVVSWSWTFGDGATLEGTDPLINQNPTHVYETAGVYPVSLTVSNGTDQLVSTVSGFVTVFPQGQNDAPFAEGFESSWPANNWSVYNENNDETFEVTPTAEFSGDKSLKLRNFNNTVGGNEDVLYSATYDMSTATAIYVSYKWSYANKVNETDDMLRISVSGDCGQTWQVRKIRKGLSNLPTADPINSQFTPTSQAQWNGETLTLTQSQWFTSQFRVKFEFFGEGGNNLYLDDINITADMPVSVLNTSAPALIFNLYPNPSDEQVSLEVAGAFGQQVGIGLYDSTGRLVTTIYNGALTSGRQTLTIPRQAAGLYFVRIDHEGVVSEQKLIFQ